MPLEPTHLYVSYVAGVASTHETSYKHCGTLKFIDLSGRVLDTVKLYHIIYLQLVGVTNVSVRNSFQAEIITSKNFSLKHNSDLM